MKNGVTITLHITEYPNVFAIIPAIEGPTRLTFFMQEFAKMESDIKTFTTSEDIPMSYGIARRKDQVMNNNMLRFYKFCRELDLTCD